MNSLSRLPRLSRTREERKGAGNRYLDLLDRSLSNREISEKSISLYEVSESTLSPVHYSTGCEKSEISGETTHAMAILNLAGNSSQSFGAR
jgi:hypothetical protein